MCTAGSCYYCQRGLYNLCDDLHLLGITPGYPGGFAEQMVLTARNPGERHRPPHAAGHELCPCRPGRTVQLGAGLPREDQHPPGRYRAGDGRRADRLLHIAVAQARGARVILSEPSPVRREMAQAFHPAVIIDPSQEDVPARIRELTGGLGVDAVICANPVAATQTQAVEVVRKGGKVVLFGGLPKASPMTSLDGNRIHYGEIRWWVLLLPSLIPRDGAGGHPAGSIPADQVITHTFPLEEIDAAFQTAASGEALKVMVKA